MKHATAVEIVDYAPAFGDAFGRLNREWLERYFRVEPIDERVLSAPETEILGHGGLILYAVAGDEAVGTVALKYHGDGVFELTKMAVTAAWQGHGIGRRLMEAAIDRYRAAGGSCLYLESHSSLAPALALYESAGFCHTPRPQPSDYERSDVYMELRN